ncbi:MAG: nitrous oxide-stimulated promoter family protein [Dehalococcoidales bacterium]|nr:nitrous oxide-stimulated promoter family protein [Dehalococcoidales bacterium]
MIGDYCRAHHPAEHPCEECRELTGYALERLEKCPYGEGKTTCAKCPVHCFRPEMREKIRTVMRYAGPRMTCRHPLVAIRHLLDSRRKEPVQQEEEGA